MTPTEPQVQAALDAAVQRIQATAVAVADRAADLLGTMALSSTRTADRDQMIAAQHELRRHMAGFQLGFRDVLRENVEKETAQRNDGRRRLEATDWQSLTLVGDDEIEQRMQSDRISQAILQDCDWEQRELATYIGGLLRLDRAIEERNPLRPSVLGKALVQAIDAATREADLRKLLARELGPAFAKAMKACYGEILQDLRARGVRPVGLAVRTADGPGYSAPGGFDTGYGTLPGSDSRGAGLAPTSPGALPALGGVGPSTGYGTRSGPMSGYGGGAPRTPGDPQADRQLMSLLRKLTSLATRPGALDGPSTGGLLPGAGSGFDAAGGAVAVNLIRAHRDELMQASTGKLDHLVIDIVGSLFDQILSDPRVPPQMARQIARLQLPVLRVAMHDASFFSSRRHPVRRFVNRIASLACAFDEFDDGPGKSFLARVRALVQEIVDGDFDQIDLYARKLDELEHFIGGQTQEQVAQSPAAATLESKESELRVQQRYMLQLTAELKPLALPAYLAEFLAQVWSQALVLAARRDGEQSERYLRYRRVGRDLVMSVQPKGSPQLRKQFLMQLPGLMKDLNEGMAFVGWPEAAQKAFFGQLLPAHAESLKRPPLSDLDHNLLAKRLETVFGVAVPAPASLKASDTVSDVPEEVLEKRFSAEEAQAVGLLQEAAVDWSGSVDIDLGADAAEVAEVDSAPVDLGLDIDLDLSAEPAEPTRGPQLMDHVQLGFAYRMLLKDEWQKVRLTYVSPGRAFFVFTHGKKHQQTISMTARMLARMCETHRMRAFENGYLLERATARARKQLAALKATPTRV